MGTIVRARRPGPVARCIVRALGLGSVLLMMAAVASPAYAYKEWNHATALGKRSCAVGCHSDRAPTNATCTGCHSGFTARSDQKCWTCHEPGQATSALQSAAGCTLTCHLWTPTGEQPRYDTPYAHVQRVHLGSSGYGKTCVDCHGVSLGPAAPGTSPHHDAADSSPPSCRACHDGVRAASQTLHDGLTACTACHTGMDLPGVPATCAGCHAVATFGDGACTASSCHGSSVVHDPTPSLGKACTDCHAAHYQSLGACTTCHPSVSAYHHLDEAATPLADCVACHDGGVAAAPSGHDAFGAACNGCHSGMDGLSGDCAACHVGAAGGATLPRIDYTNDMACDDPACHGAVVAHGPTQIATVACATCHIGHYASLAPCAACHPDPQSFHHGTAKARPLADCVACHDGGVAAAQASHDGVPCAACHRGMDAPSVPVTCSRCHFPKTYGAGDCIGCHSATGLTGREQVHTPTPGAGLTCASCHGAHHLDLGGCEGCHALVPEVHHGTVDVTGADLTLQAQPSRITSGASAVLSGVLTAAGAPVAGVEVRVQERRFSEVSFTDVAALLTGPDGGFSLRTRPVAGTEYRAVYRGAGTGASPTVEGPAITQTTVRVGQRVKVWARPRLARPRMRVRVSGTVVPSAERLGGPSPAVGLRAERRVGSRWVKIRAARVLPAPGGSFTWSLRLVRTGTYRVTATLAATTELLGASDKTVIRVR